MDGSIVAPLLNSKHQVIFCDFTRVSSQMCANFGPSFIVGRNSLRIPSEDSLENFA